MGVTVSSFLVESSRFALELGVAHRWLLAFIESGADERTSLVFAPEARVRLGSTCVLGRNLPEGARVGASGIDLFLSQWWWRAGGEPRSTLTVGVGLSLSLGL